MSDFSQLAFNHSGRAVRAAMHADAGKATKILGPSWANTALVRFYASATTPPTSPTNAGGWWDYADSSRAAGDLIGTAAFPVASGEAVEIRRREILGGFDFDLACDGAAGVAQIIWGKV